MPVNLNGFEKIVSLGYNCEVSFRIEQYLGRQIDSYPLSWAYVSGQDKMDRALEQSANGTLLLGHYTVNASDMFHFDEANISFHSKAEDKQLLRLPDGSTNYPEAEKALAEMRQRFGHLEEKFGRLFVEGPSTLFLLKAMTIYTLKETMDHICTVRDYLTAHFANRNFFWWRWWTSRTGTTRC